MAELTEEQKRIIREGTRASRGINDSTSSTYETFVSEPALYTAMRELSEEAYKRVELQERINELQQEVREDSAGGFDCSYTERQIRRLQEKMARCNPVIERLRGSKVYDIGSGSNPFIPAQESRCLDIQEWYMVDPFLNEEEMRKDLKQRWERAKNGPLATDRYDRIIPVRMDGAGFLLRQPEKSGNVITAAVDDIILRNDEYANLLVEAIERAIPKGGIWVSYSCPGLERIAQERGNITEVERGSGFKEIGLPEVVKVFDRYSS